jgi:hypothetical protein
MFEKKILFFLILLSLIIFTLFPHIQTKFTTNDDTRNEIQALQGSRLTSAMNEAIDQGRFHFVFSTLVLFIPYLWDTIYYYQFIRLGAILLNLLLYFILIKDLSNSRKLAMFATVLALAFLPNNWQHNLLTSYPFHFHWGLSMFLLSMICFLKAVEKGAYRSSIMSSIFFLAACMTYESFIPLMIVYAIIAIVIRNDFPLSKTIGARVIYFLVPHLCVVFVYLVIYLVFRSYFPVHYPGAQFRIISFKHVLNVMVQFIRSTFPGYFYFRDPGSMAITFDGLIDDYGGFVALFKHMKGDWLLKGSMVVMASWVLLQQSSNLFTKRAFWIAVALGSGMMILTLSPLAFTPKYQEWVAHGVLAYAYCYYSYFGTILLISTLVIGINQIIFNRKIIRYTFIVLVSCLLFLSSLATDFYNYYITLDQQFSQAKWNAFDLFLQTPDFRQIPDGSILYAPTLWRHRGIVANHPSYWSDYVRTKTKRNIMIASSREEIGEVYNHKNSSKLYFLSIWQEEKDSSQFLLFAEIDKENNFKLLPLSKKINVFIYGKHRKCYIFGTLSPDEQKPMITIDGKETHDLMSNVFGGFIDNTLKPAHLKKALLQSNALLDLENINVTFFPVPMRISNHRHHFGNGFYTQEENSEKHTWNWSSGNAVLEIVNCLPKPNKVLVEFRLGSLEPQRIEVLFRGMTKESYEFRSNEDRMVRIGVVLEPGLNFLEIHTNTPAVKPKNSEDKRNLAFRVDDLTVTELSGGTRSPLN